MTLGLTPYRGAPKLEPPRPPLATAGIPAMPGPIPPVLGAAVVQLCDANVTGVLAAGTPAPPAQLGGTDSGPIDAPGPAAANTGAAPMPPTPPTAPTGPTSPARPAPKPPRSALAVEGPASADSRPPPPIPIRSDSAEVKLPTSSSGTWIRLLFKPPGRMPNPVPRNDVRLLMRSVMGVSDCALDAALDAPLDSEFAAAAAWLADSVSW